MTGTSTEDSTKLIEALTTDLDQGFVDMFGTYQHVLFSVALRVSGRHADAQDLTADAFLRAYRALSGYAPERIRSLQLRGWLVTILLNVWRNHQRNMSRQPQQTALELAPDLIDGRHDVEAAAEHGETSRKLAGLLARLPEPQRLAVVLRHVTDMPIAEIAVVLDCPQGTVKSHISRGLRQLRESFEGSTR